MRKVSIRIQIMLWYTLLTAVLLAVSLPVLYGAMAGFYLQSSNCRVYPRMEQYYQSCYIITVTFTNEQVSC